jgi:enoyl-CoA hydratase/carnithine racemase
MTTQMTYETIRTEERGRVATVALNRPERMNAWTRRMEAELGHAIAGFEVRDDIGAIIVTGTGRAFCAGADLDEDQTSDATLQELFRPATDRPYWEMRTPTIAAINGAAVGVGITLPMKLDIRIAAEDAKLGFVFTRRGLTPEFGASWILPRLVGAANAMELLLTGRIFDGREAVRLGLANEAHPADRVLARAREIADDIVCNVSPVAAAVTKSLVYRGLEAKDLSAHAQLEQELYDWALGGADFPEGMASFAEKRVPEWHLGKNAAFPAELFRAPDDGAQRK